MTPPRRLLLVAGLLVVASLAWWWFATADERRVKAGMRELAASMNVPAGEAEMERLARLAQLARRLAAGFSATAADHPSLEISREDVLALSGTVRFPAGLTVTIDELSVEILESGRRATATALAEAREPDPGANRPLVERRRVTVDWVCEQSVWQATRATLGPAETAPAEGGS